MNRDTWIILIGVFSSAFIMIVTIKYWLPTAAVILYQLFYIVSRPS